jgi:NADH:ubiquinone oxidoreductase subunit
MKLFSFLAKIFIWWDGATLGTSWFTLRKGKKIGQDVHGNIYYEGGKTVHGLPQRWVIYTSANDASYVPPEWHGWLHHSLELPPEQSLPEAHIWEKAPQPNLTGTRYAFEFVAMPKPLAKGAAKSVANQAEGAGYTPWSP